MVTLAVRNGRPGRKKRYNRTYEDTLALTHEEKGKMVTTEYTVTYQDGTLTLSGGAEDIVLTPYADASDSEAFAKLQHQPDSLEAVYENGAITGAWTSGCNAYIFYEM